MSCSCGSLSQSLTNFKSQGRREVGKEIKVREERWRDRCPKLSSGQLSSTSTKHLLSARLRPNSGNSEHDQPFNSWGTMQNENVGSFVQKLLRISR